MSSPSVAKMAFLAVAAFCYATLGCLHIIFLAGTRADAAGLPESGAVVPGLIIWGLLWIILAWLTGASKSLAAMLLVTTAWLVLHLGPPFDDWLLVNLLVAATGAVAAWIVTIGARAAGAATAGGHRSIAGGITSSVVSLGLSYGMLLVTTRATNPSTNNVFIVFFWLLILVPLLISSFVLGYYLPGILAKTIHLWRNKWAVVVLLPIISLAASHLVLVSQEEAMLVLKEETVQKFIGYIDREIAGFPSDARIEIDAVGSGFAEIDCTEIGKSDGVERYLRAGLPYNWSPNLGLRRPVRLHSLEYSVGTDESGQWIADKYARTLPDRAKLQWLLKHLSASQRIQNADWKLESRRLWKDPYTGKRDDQFRSWHTECSINGSSVCLRALPGWTLVVQQTEE